MEERHQKWLDRKLLEAFKQSNEEDVIILLELGANIKSIDSNMNVEFCEQIMPLISVQCERGKLKLVQLLHKIGADLNKLDAMGRSPLHHSTCNIDGVGYYDISEYLVNNGAKVNAIATFSIMRDEADWDTSLKRACRIADSKTAKFLLDNGADLTLGDAYKFTEELIDRSHRIGSSNDTVKAYEETLNTLKEYKDDLLV